MRARREVERAWRLNPGRADVAWAVLRVRERGRDWTGAIEICGEIKEMPGERERAEKKLRELEALRDRGVKQRDATEVLLERLDAGKPAPRGLGR